MKKSEDRLHIVENEILIYQTEDGQTKIDVKLEDETVYNGIVIQDTSRDIF